jgi:membrane protein
LNQIASAVQLRVENAWLWLCELPDRLLFGSTSRRAGLVPALMRVARYPYALVRDLIGGKLNLHAMGLVYASLLSIIPLVALSFGLLKAFDAQDALRPLVHDFFDPMGAAADQFTDQVMGFAKKVRGGLVGSLGFGVLVWTLLGTMRKVEDGFNFVWHVDVPRGFARRCAEYGVLLVVGPLLLGAVIVFSRVAIDSAPAQLLEQVPLIDRFMGLTLKLAPYVLVSAMLAGLYVAIPNTRVRLRPALIGGIAAGILWVMIGRFFTLFVLYSARLTVVYAGFAIMIAALVWTYFGWTILLLGAQLSFYIQNPAYLRSGIREPRLSSADIERAALGIMYLIAVRQRYGGRRDTIASLALRLDFPAIAVARVCAGLEQAGYIVRADDQALVLGCDATQLRVLDILVTARSQRSGLIRRAAATPAAVEAFCIDIDRCCEQRYAALSLAELIESKPGPAVPDSVTPASLAGDGQSVDQH